ncbi:MAG TPA: BTAD domain-containing putative transcriptional regulator [Actinomycetota bacterium]
MAVIQITLLGGFAVRVDGRAVPAGVWRHRRAAEVVKLLALADGHRLHREQVKDALWPALDAEAAGANLRKALHFARRGLGTEQAIAGDGEMLVLDPAVELDVDRFEQAARDTRSGAGVADAIAHYGGELLPDERYAAWAAEPRERLRRTQIALLKEAGEWERVLAIDPADEEAHQALMRAALDRGDRRGAMRQFEHLRERLRVDLGLGPERRSVELYEEALAMEGTEPATSAERARAAIAWGLVQLNMGDFERAARSATDARTIALAAGLGMEMGEASALLGMLANMQGRWKEVFRREFIASIRQSPEVGNFLFDAHLCLAEFCLCGPTGHEEIVEYASELLDAARDAGSIRGQALAELLLGETSLFSDRLDEAEGHLATAETLHERAGAASGRALAVQRLAEAALARGQRWKAGRFLARAGRLARDDRLAPHLMVRIFGTAVDAASDEAAAIGALEQADQALYDTETCRPCSMGFRVAASIALARAGRLAEAKTRLDQAEAFAGMWRGGPWQAAVWEARGVLRNAEGDEERAVAMFKEAAERFAEVRRPRDEARCRREAETFA